MSVTLKDIARKVGYSVTTVSRALNDYGDVSEETKQLIKRVAQEMGYHPHVIAQSLQRRRTNTEEDLSNPFWAHITLAFRDIPPSMYDEVLDYLREAPLPTEPFIADTFHFLEFFSQDWEGDWEQTLTWRLLKSWRV